MICCMIERRDKGRPVSPALCQPLSQIASFLFLVERPGEIVPPGLSAAVKKVLSAPAGPCGSGEARDFFIQNRKIFLYFVTENRKPLRKRKKQMKSSDFLPGRPGYRRYLEHPGTVGNSCLARTRQYPNQGEATV